MSLRIALLSYRSKPHCGGQGVYVRHLSRELVALGHDVEVFSGQPYPDLDEGVRLTKVPSLDLYREPDPFRVPRLREFRDLVDVEEFLTMCVAGFPEPKTFGKRIARVLRGRVADFDVVHDNQVLAHGILDVEALGLPVVTTIHHPITVDRRLDLAARRHLEAPADAAPVVRLPAHADQGRPPRPVDPHRRRRPPSATSSRTSASTRPGSGSSRSASTTASGRRPRRACPAASWRWPAPTCRSRASPTCSRRSPSCAPSATTSSCCSSPSRPAGGRTQQIVDRLAIAEHVRFVHGISDAELVELMGSAEVACVPSLYEGFSLPTAELMACATPLVVSDAGAIPEVVGPDGFCADIVPPGDVEALTRALGDLLDDPERRERYGAAGRARVEELFSWRAVAAATATAYEEASHVLTVDFDRLGLRPGERVLDMGCGGGRHAFEMYRRGADVVAFDQDADELATVSDMFAEMRRAGEVPDGAEADVKEGDALALPFGDGEFDRVVAAEILEHVPADIQAIQELVRVTRPGGTIALTVPRWLPEIDLLAAVEGVPRHPRRPHPDLHRQGAGHQGGERRPGAARQGVRPRPALAVLVAQVRRRREERRQPAVRAYHRLLVWDIMKKPRTTRLAERVLDPVIGKSLVLYFAEAAELTLTRAAGRLGRRRSSPCRSRTARSRGRPAAHTDVWNHLESAMALTVAGEHDAAERASPGCSPASGPTARGR